MKLDPMQLPIMVTNASRTDREGTEITERAVYLVKIEGTRNSSIVGGLVGRGIGSAHLSQKSRHRHRHRQERSSNRGWRTVLCSRRLVEGAGACVKHAVGLGCVVEWKGEGGGEE
jgi:hypothetical protein